MYQVPLVRTPATTKLPHPQRPLLWRTGLVTGSSLATQLSAGMPFVAITSSSDLAAKVFCGISGHSPREVLS